ncbi:MAG: putative rane protein [Solirubrobacteraceae bacterium]
MSGAVLAAELLCAAAVYVWAARRVRRWPRWRAVAFLGGLVAMAIALVALDAAADRTLVGHMVQHLVLVYAAAPLLVLGSPIALGLRAAGRPARRLLRAPALAHPLVGWCALPAAMAVTHFTGLYDLAVRHPLVHVGEHALYLAAAVLFWRPVIGADPVPHRPGFTGRLLYLMLAAGPLALVGVAMQASTLPWYEAYAGPGALADQHDAGAVMWVGGGLALAAATMAVAWSGLLREHRRQVAVEAASGVAR